MKKIFNLILIFVFSFLYFSDVSIKANSNNFLDRTNVLDDLMASGDFDPNDFPKNPYGNVDVISFIEFCYSDSSSVDYGLYVYVYNPKLLEFVDKVHLNKIQIGISADDEGRINNYKKFSLKLINSSDDRLFYKFKVLDTADEIYNFVKDYSLKNQGKRLYLVSGIELCEKGKSSSVEYNVSTRYEYFGFAEGCGDYDNFPLDFLAEKAESIELEVYQTFYRTLSSSKGAGFRNQLNSVYFAVPNYYFEEYGKLQKIRAEWFEFKTKDIIVTSNLDFYLRANDYIGFSTDSYNDDIHYMLVSGLYPFGGGGAGTGASWGYNVGSPYIINQNLLMKTIYYLFYTPNIESYDPNRAVVGGVSVDVLTPYIYNYRKSFNGGYLYLNDKGISADLFETDIDEYRKIDNEFGKIQFGYSFYEFDADIDYFDLVSWEAGNPSFWDNLREFGFWDYIFGRIPDDEGIEDLPPIISVKFSDLSGDDLEVSSDFLINYSDVSDFREFVRESEAEGKTVVLFRFACTDYFSEPIIIVDPDGGVLGNVKNISGQAYRAWQSVFLDFDVIQLSFSKAGKLYVFPAVSNPQDIINPIDPPVLFPDGEVWKLVLALILLLFVVIILAPFVPLLIRGFVFIIFFPFRLVGLFLDSIFGKKKRWKRW